MVKAEIKKRETDFQKGINQYKALAEQGHTMLETIKPYMPIIQAEGGNPVTAIGNLLNTAYRLRTGTAQERGKLVMMLAREYGADITPYIGQQSQPQGDAAAAAAAGIDPAALQQYIDNLVAQRTAPLQQFQHQTLTQQQREEEERQRATVSHIQQFRTATDEQGRPKHVYFDNVRGLMATLVESGEATTLDQAYEMACRAHPEVSKAIAVERQRAEESKRLEEARKRAEEARRAGGANISGQGGVGIADTSKITLRDELASHFDAAAA